MADTQEYVVPIGADITGLNKGLDEAIDKLGKLSQKSSDAGADMDKSMGKGAKAVEEIEQKVKPAIDAFEKFRQQGAQTGKELANVFNLKGAGKEFNATLDGFKKRLDALTKMKFVLNVDDSQVALLQKQLQNATNDIGDMTKAFDTARAIMERLDPNSEEYRILGENVNFAEAAFNEFTKGVQQAVEDGDSLASTYKQASGGMKTLGERLKDTENRMYDLALAGQQNTEEYKALQDQAIKYRKTIDDVSGAVKNYSKTAVAIGVTMDALKGLAGGFAAVQGAAALFGDENEDVEQALLKVNAAMSVLQGLQAVNEVLSKKSAISTLLFRTATQESTVSIQAQTGALEGQAVATTAASVATRVFSTALKAIGIGLLISAIAALIENWDKVKAAMNNLLPAGLSVQKMFESIKEMAAGVGNAILKFIATPFKAINALLHGNLTEFQNTIKDGLAFKKNYQEGFDKQELATQKAHMRELEKNEIDAYAREFERRKNRGEDVSKLEIILQKRRVDMYDKGTKDYDANLKELEDLQDAAYKKQKDQDASAAKERAQQAKQAAKEREQQQKEAERKRLELQKQTNDQIKQYAKDLEDFQIGQIKDGSDKERAQINLDAKRKVDEIKSQTALSKEAQQQQAELLVAIEKDRVAKIKAVDEQENKDKLALQLEGAKALYDLEEDNLKTRLALLDIDTAQRRVAIQQQYKDEADLQKQLLTALDESTARERKKLIDKSSSDQLAQQRDKEILAIELSSKYAVQSEKVERQKQIAILNTQIEFQQKYINSLIAGGKNENDVVVLKAKKQLQDLQNSLKTETEKSQTDGGFDFLTFIGLGDIDDTMRKRVGDAAKTMGDNLSKITDFIVSQYDRQIDAKQKVIDAIDDSIDDLEDQLDKEKELRENGYANNVEVIEKELAAKQAQKDAEVKQQEELQAKKAKLQQAQMVADTAVQFVNLATSSTEIFKSLAPLGPFGIGLAIATIATMFGAFAAAKITAAQAIKQGTPQQYGTGGWIDGKSHAQGGKKYYSPDGEVRELEKDEFVVRKKQAIKFGNLLEAINNNQFTGFDVNDNGLVEMLAGMGISMAEESSRKALRDFDALNSMSYIFNVSAPGAKEMEEMNANIKYLAQQERERVQTWEDANYIYVKKGNKTIRTPKFKPVEETEDANK